MQKLQRSPSCYYSSESQAIQTTPWIFLNFNPRSLAGLVKQRREGAPKSGVGAHRGRGEVGEKLQGVERNLGVGSVGARGGRKGLLRGAGDPAAAVVWRSWAAVSGSWRTVGGPGRWLRGLLGTRKGGGGSSAAAQEAAALMVAAAALDAGGSSAWCSEQGGEKGEDVVELAGRV